MGIGFYVFFYSLFFPTVYFFWGFFFLLMNNTTTAMIWKTSLCSKTMVEKTHCAHSRRGGWQRPWHASRRAAPWTAACLGAKTAWLPCTIVAPCKRDSRRLARPWVREAASPSWARATGSSGQRAWLGLQPPELKGRRPCMFSSMEKMRKGCPHLGLPFFKKISFFFKLVFF